jgi:hypothetical protein
VGVAEVLVLAQHDYEVPLIPHQGPVQQLAAAGIRQVHEQVPGLLDHPRLDRVLGGSEDAYPAGAVLYNGQDVDLRPV